MKEKITITNNSSAEFLIKYAIQEGYKLSVTYHDCEPDEFAIEDSVDAAEILDHATAAYTSLVVVKDVGGRDIVAMIVPSLMGEEQVADHHCHEFFDKMTAAYEELVGDI